MTDAKTVIVTGCCGKVGAHVAAAFKRAGWNVVGVDVVRGIYDTPKPTDPFPATYIQMDLTDAGNVFSTVARFSPAVIVHTAAIPDPTHNTPHEVFQRNLMMTFNVIEAAIRFKTPRVVYLSSEQCCGFFASDRVIPGVSGLPLYYPVDEEHACAPQNPYALSKWFGEELMAAGCRRAPAGSFTAISIRPSWCQNAGNIARNLGPLVRDASLGNEGMWSYICCADLAEACVAAATTDRVPPNQHEVVYIAAADNAGGRDLAAAVEAFYGKGTIPQKGALPRVDASGINCAKAARLLGWTPKLSWRDFLDPVSGELKPADQLPKEY